LNDIPDDTIRYICFNGAQTYTLFINKLLSHNIHLLLNNKKIIDKFISDVLTETLVPMKDVVNRFIKVHNNNFSTKETENKKQEQDKIQYKENNKANNKVNTSKSIIDS